MYLFIQMIYYVHNFYEKMYALDNSYFARKPEIRNLIM